MKTTQWKIAQKAELLWWKNYLKDKDTVEYLQWKKKYWKQLMDKFSDAVQPHALDTVLDAGCGPAGIYMVLDKCVVDAVDPLVDEYERNLSHFKKNNYPFVNFFSQPFEEFFVDKKYQLVFCMNAINHVADLKKSFGKLISSVKSDGYLIITIDAHNHSFLKYLFRLLPGDILHPHQYDIEEYKKMITVRGCEIIKEIKLKHEFFFDHYLIVGKKL